MRRVVLFGGILVIAAAAIGLGIWQLGRLGARRALNREAQATRALPPASIVAGRSDSLASNRRVRVSGAFDQANEFLLRGRLIQGVPAVQVITPLRIPGLDTAILVNRGYVPAPDATDPGPVTWSEGGGEIVTVAGTLLSVPDRGDGKPLTRAGKETWNTFDLTAMRARLPYPLSPFYVVAAAPDTGVVHTIRGREYPFRAEVPPLDDGPHLMYAVQWFGIAIALLAFGFLFVLRRPPPRTIE